MKNNKKIIQKIVVGGVLINKNREVLILQRSKDEKIYPNMWELPSGKKDPLEQTTKAMLREFKEEVGIDIKIIDIISTFDYIIEKSDETRDSTQINFLVKMVNPAEDIKISKEHENYTWVKEGLLKDYNLTESTKKVIKKALLI